MNEINPQLEGAVSGEREPREALESAEDTVNEDIL